MVSISKHLLYKLFKCATADELFLRIHTDDFYLTAPIVKIEQNDLILLVGTTGKCYIGIHLKTLKEFIASPERFGSYPNGINHFEEITHDR